MKKDVTNKAKFYVINGYPGSGKDTFVDLVKEVADSSFSIYNFSTVDEVKDIYYSFSDTTEKTEAVRKDLSKLKAFLVKEFDAPFIWMSQRIKHERERNAILGFYPVFFLHSREPEEIERFKTYFGAKTIFVDRKDHLNIDNPSDLNVGNYDYDIVIHNDEGLKELKEIAKAFAKTL